MADPAIASSFSIANINPGVVRSEFMRSIMATVNHERTLQHTHDPQTPRVQFDQFLDRFAGPYLDDERNRCVEWFNTQTTSDYLLFVDSDTGFRAEQPFELVTLATQLDLKLVGGVYMNAWSNFPTDTQGSGTGPVAYRWEDAEDGTRFLAKIPWKEVDACEDPTMPVDAMGTGFMAIHRDLLKLLEVRYGFPCPWFAEPVLNGVHMGEDMTLCLRATLEGHRPQLATKILVDHYKTCMIRPIPTEPDDG